MLSSELEHILQLLYREARNARYEFISLEHLLLVLIEEDAAVPNVLKLCGADLKVLSEQLAASVAENTPQIPDHLLDTVETQPTLGFQRVIQRAMVHTQSAGKAAVEPLDILVAMMSESESHAVYFLKLQSITRFEVLRCIAHGSPDDEDGNDSDGLERDGEEAEQRTGSLSDYTVNLNAEVKAGRIDPLIGRKHEMERLVQILCRRRKNNPLLVGEAGVGKTALAEGLAHQIVNGDIPDTLKEAEVYALDMGSLLAGTKYRGDFEARVKSVLKQLEKNPARYFVYRRNPHHHRRGQHQRRHDGRVQSAQTRISERLIALYRSDYLRRIPHHFRQRPRLKSPFPKKLTWSNPPFPKPFKSCAA